MGQGGVACPKPEKLRRTKARKVRQKLNETHEVRAYVFMRERDVCRCCRARAAHSMHELKPRSVGGKPSKENSIAVCGSGTTLCHGLLQQHQIVWTCNPLHGAEMWLEFTPKTKRATDHMKLTLGESILSPPMRDYILEAEA